MFLVRSILQVSSPIDLPLPKPERLFFVRREDRARTADPRISGADEWHAAGTLVPWWLGSDEERRWRPVSSPKSLIRYRETIPGDGAVARPPGAIVDSIVLPLHIDAEQFAVCADPDDEQHGAAAHGAVLHQPAVAGGTVQQYGVAHPAPGTGDIGLMEHFE